MEGLATIRRLTALFANKSFFLSSIFLVAPQTRRRLPKLALALALDLQSCCELSAHSTWELAFACSRHLDMLQREQVARKTPPAFENKATMADLAAIKVVLLDIGKKQVQQV